MRRCAGFVQHSAAWGRWHPGRRTDWSCRPQAAARSWASSAGADPAYIRAQRERLQVQLDFEADVSAGRRPARDSMRERIARNPLAYGAAGGLTLLAAGGLYWKLVP